MKCWKQRIGFRNTWTKDSFCAGEWDNECIDSCKGAIDDYFIDFNVDNKSGKV